MTPSCRRAASASATKALANSYDLGPKLGMPNYRLAAVFAFVMATLSVAPASALPVFAHRYGFTCQQCHTTVPQLNGFGEAFLHRGFRLPGARGVSPVAVKVNTAYSSQSSGGGASLPKAIVDEIEVLSAGSLGKNSSYFAEQYVLDGGVAGRPRDAWVQLDQNAGAAPGMHVRLGQFTLPLPVDPETQRPTLAHYSLYDQTIGANGFSFFDPRVGVDTFYADYSRGFEAHVAAVRAYDRGSGVASDGLDVMGTLSQTFGATTLYAYRYQGQRTTRPQHDSFARNGFAVERDFGQFTATALMQTGVDGSADGFGLNARSSGGFFQAGWHPSSGVNLYARLDSTNDDFNGRANAGTLSLILRPRANMRFTIEATRGSDHTNQLGLGWLFAY